MACVCLLLPSSWDHYSANARQFEDKYDEQIEKAVKRWWRTEGDWHWWKAQLYQESLLDPNALSPVGASGLAQFMPATWDDVSHRLGLVGVSPRSAKHAIDAGAYYMSTLSRGWSSERPALDRLQLAQASYNAGFGSLLAAQRACNGAVMYDGIICCLPSITGRHSDETIGYVYRIAIWKQQMDIDR